MPAAYQELFLEKGSTFTTSITLDDVYGIPYDLTGLQLKSQVRKSYYSSNATAEFVITISHPEQGVLSFSMNSANTANIAPGRYLYDVVIKDKQENHIFTHKWNVIENGNYFYQKLWLYCKKRINEGKCLKFRNSPEINPLISKFFSKI